MIVSVALPLTDSVYVELPTAMLRTAEAEVPETLTRLLVLCLQFIADASDDAIVESVLPVATV